MSQQGSSSDDVIRGLVEAVRYSVDLLHRAAQGDDAAEELPKLNVGDWTKATSNRLDEARFIISHAAPLLAELRQLRVSEPQTGPLMH